MTRRRWLASLVLAPLLLGPVPADAADVRFIDYAVEWFDPTGLMIATGWLHVALVPEGTEGHRIEGRYRPDRRDEGAPWLSPRGSRVWGQIHVDRLELGLRIYLLEAVRVEARVIDGDVRRLQGQWRFPDNRGFRYGAWRAYAIENATTIRPQP